MNHKILIDSSLSCVTGSLLVEYCYFGDELQEC